MSESGEGGRQRRGREVMDRSEGGAEEGDRYMTGRG